MKKCLLILLFLISFNCFSQESVEYLENISSLQTDISKKYLSYISSVSHGKSARKVDKNRKELLQTVQSSKAKAQNTHAFKGDLSLKNGVKNYLDILYNVLNEDYGKIINMEDVAEQSYDAMEAYFLAQELAGKKSDEAFNKYQEAYKLFAKKNNINLIEEKSKLSDKLSKSAQVNAYYHRMYLVFFKPYKQEVYMVDAQVKKDISGIEQNKNTLFKNSKEAISILDTTKAFYNDRSLVIAAKELMLFFVEETAKSKTITDFYLKSENFDKMNKAFNSKSAKARTQSDVDNYNASVNDLNSSLQTFNNLNNDLNKKRSAVIDKWNKATSKFLDYHMPKY